MYSYRIVNAKKIEEKFINDAISFIQCNYSNKLKMEQLKEIEVVDMLSGGASGRAIRDKLFLARKNGLGMLKNKIYDESQMESDDELRDMLSTIYHELWHISTWEKYQYMYEYVLNEKNDDITAYAYLYWIEYIAHMETVFMEVPKRMIDFCQSFLDAKWEKNYYLYFIKSLPYYLVRSQYLGLYEEFTFKIKNKELQKVIYEFDKVSGQLFKDRQLNDLQTANVLRKMISDLLS